MKQVVLLLLLVVIISGGLFLRETFFAGMQEKKTPGSLEVSPIQTKQNIDTTLFNTNKPAPELIGITAWLNTEKPISIGSLQGKVVLIDFWTNQCINCIHTLPYITKWYDTYKDQGFVIIGIHTPELSYEYTIDSIKKAIAQYGIHYPVAQDNNYATWNAYANQYWPAIYLIDKKGNIRRTYFGEGEYDKTELAIQSLLKE